MKSIDPQVLGTSALDWIVVQHSCEMVAVQQIFDLFWYDHDDVNADDDGDDEELLEIIMRRVCCVQCGVVCTPDYLRINQIMPHAMLKWIPMIVMMDTWLLYMLSAIHSTYPSWGKPRRRRQAHWYSSVILS